MTVLRIPLLMVLLLCAAACVTINVYFPAEATEKAADRIIRDVYGEKPEPQSRNGPHAVIAGRADLWLDWLIRPAHAEADISVNTPAIRQLKTSMEQRHKSLAPYYDSGAVGIAQNGQLEIRDQKLVPLKDRNTVKQLVAAENRDRDALYKEIARANSHPEWEPEIQQVFARRWVDNARRGWWYIGKNGKWTQK